MQNTAVYAPITFEEIVMVMIKGVIELVISNRPRTSRSADFEITGPITP